MTKRNFDWMKWAEIEEDDYDKVLSEAKKFRVPIFDSDSKSDVFNRLLSIKALKYNIKMVYINIALTLISLISAVAAVYTLKG